MRNRPSAAGLLTVIVLFQLSAFALLSFRGGSFDYAAIVMGVISSALLVFQYGILKALFRGIDRYVLIISNTLAGVGLIVQYRLEPSIAHRQIVFLAIGMVVMMAVMLIIRKIFIWDGSVWWLMGLSLVFLASSLVFGRTVGGARNWFNIFGFSLQPSEFVKVALVFISAACFSRVQKKRQLLPIILFTGACLMILVVSRDLGAALLYAGTVLIMFYAATSDILLTGAGLLAAGVGAVASYHLFDHVKVRVEMWKNPWADYSNKGYQIVQGLMAIASGGFLGLGLGNGSPGSIPARHTDYIFAVICEEFGMIFGFAVVAFYLVLVVRGALIALGASNRFHALLALGCTSLLTLQSFIIIGGVIKLIPLTGITLPFISYGGSSMIASMALMGILQAVATMNSDERDRSVVADG
ncbi:MAG: FtsW/RodA/SpoVE family cell cycle protein [Christensenellales bacterium]|jgi:cell division protein FtsW (lipid II flippase)